MYAETVSLIISEYLLTLYLKKFTSRGVDKKIR